MRRLAAAFVFFFLTSLTLAAYGHCWPMLAMQMERQAAPHSSHDHGDHEQRHHHHPTEGLGQELSVPGVQTAPAVIVGAPVAKSFAPLLLAVAAVELGWPNVAVRLHHRARAGPPAFAEFHARTGRLLI